MNDTLTYMKRSSASAARLSVSGSCDIILLGALSHRAGRPTTLWLAVAELLSASFKLGLSRRLSFQIISELEKMGFVERLTLPKHSTKKGTGSHLRFYISPKL